MAISPGTATAQIYNDCSSTNITSAAYVQLLASAGIESGWAFIANSSTSTIKLAVGPSGSETDQIQVPASCLGMLVPLAISKGHRITAKSLKTATISAGEVLITLFR